MATKVILPKVDMDQEAGTIVEWLKSEGDQVQQGELILVIETDKVAIDVEAPASGILQGIRAQPGDNLPIGTVIAYILDSGESLPDDETPSIEKVEEQKPTEIHKDAGITPVARKFAEDRGVDLLSVTGTGAGGKITKQDIEAVISRRHNGVEDDEQVYATPKARRLARQSGIELALVDGSGPVGRIQADDVVAHQAMAQSSAKIDDLHSDEVIPLQGMRRTIAERMTASYQSVPHINFTIRADMTNFEIARSRFMTKAQASLGPSTKVSMTALFVKLLAINLRQHPWLNSSLSEEQIILRNNINIGVAVALPDGLIVPVLKNADQKDLRQITSEVDELVERARDGKLSPGDVKGGTFTLSNLGPFGIEQFTAIINPGQSAILAVGSMKQEVIPVDDQPQIRPVIAMTLSVDHRIVDGVVAAHFMSDLKAVLEDSVLALW
jgi:pyruvate dehydrogenase E2 component (dihydrolipoamide acetyltransferase)